MKTEDILTIEESGENRINLVRDRLFWQAWNRSALLIKFLVGKDVFTGLMICRTTTIKNDPAECRVIWDWRVIFRGEFFDVDFSILYPLLPQQILFLSQHK